MKNWFAAFNIYLCLILLGPGCASIEKAKQKREQSTLRFHLEVNQDGTGRSGPVLVTHDRIPINVEKEPFITEGDLEKALVIDTLGGFAIQVVFDAIATAHLDLITSANKGHHIAIMTQFPKTHWVAAPLINRRIATGIFTFTPDLTCEEAQRMVRGLNNVAAKAKKAK